jgi:hypothetical protein
MTMRQKGMANTPTRTIRFRVVVFAASVLAMATLAACHGTSGGGGYSGGGNTGTGVSGTNGGGTGGGGGTDGGGSTVTGTVIWPDGNAAANASVFFYNYDPGFTASGWSNGQYEVQQLPADGSYSLSGCPCQDLTAYLYIPGTSGGQACWIIMQDDNQTYSGRPANPGDTIKWQALDLPCSATWYTSDQSSVQTEATTVLPQLNSGSWQSWEASTSGTGSGG